MLPHKGELIFWNDCLEGNDLYRMDEFRNKIGSRTGEERLKKLAEKFVTYFSGTFQCNVGHQVMKILELEYRVI
jgi:hypothetical protein